ncbi:MAG: SRPBCC family protein [Dehalococcoidia bacterium]
MARAAKEITVAAPLRSVYNQWTQFESFPNFMEGVEEVRQITDRRLHWRATIAGKQQEWEAEIEEQVPDQKIVWRATSGDNNAGWVTFEAAGAGETKVHLEMSYEPEGVVENVGDALGLVERRVEGDLKRFKEFIEERGGQETGAWRGEIENKDAPGGHTQGQGTRGELGGDQKADL